MGAVNWDFILSEYGSWEAWTRQIQGHIRRADQAVAALFELDLAARSLATGLHVELEPKTPGHCADLALSLACPGPNTLYVEAKHLRGLPQRAYDALKLADRVLPSALLAIDLCGGARFLRAPRTDEIAELKQRVDQFWSERARERTRGELVIEGLIQVWGADRKDQEAQNYFVSHGYPKAGEFEGPPVEFHVFERIERAIREESQQLPPTHAGMIVLAAPVEPVLLQVPSEVVCQVVEMMLVPIVHISAVALIRQTPGLRRPTHEVRELGKGHLSIRSVRHLINVEEVLLIRNHARAHVDADQVVERIFLTPEPR